MAPQIHIGKAPLSQEPHYAIIPETLSGLIRHLVSLRTSSILQDTTLRPVRFPLPHANDEALLGKAAARPMSISHLYAPLLSCSGRRCNVSPYLDRPSCG